jgi:fibronectin type 3 domain-containing protein
MKKLFITLAILLLSAYAWAADVKLTWDMDIPVKNFKIYYGTIPSRPSKIMVVGDQHEAIVTGLTAGETYYFKATAVHLDGKESGFSNEVSKAVPLPVGPNILKAE